MEHAEHFVLVDDKNGGRCDGSRGSHAERLACHATLAKEVGGSKHRDHGFLTCAVHYGEFHAALLNVEDCVGIITLGEDGLAAPIFCNSPRNSSSVEKRLRVKRTQLFK